MLLPLALDRPFVDDRCCCWCDGEVTCDVGLLFAPLLFDPHACCFCTTTRLMCVNLAADTAVTLDPRAWFGDQCAAPGADRSCDARSGPPPCTACECGTTCVWCASRVVGDVGPCRVGCECDPAVDHPLDVEWRMMRRFTRQRDPTATHQRR
jgi:hypothetical protein